MIKGFLDAGYVLRATGCNAMRVWGKRVKDLFCPEKPGPLGHVRVLWLCLKNRCKSLK